MEDKYLTISQINKYIKNRFEQDENLNVVYLKGEISNFKNHTTGHLYFTLKDENSRILAVMFRNNASSLTFAPIDGMKVLVKGKISCYEANGNYQIYVNEMSEDGVGNLYLEFEKLKKKLYEKGLFDQSLKKPIPKFPKKIGVITATTGAAIRDIITTINRRYRLAEIIIFPCLVQGDGAKEDIVKNLTLASDYDLDVIILGRGGGSIEDLWAFNEEIVAEAIYNSKIPIISAVGHEIDFTISDYVADLRAPTPTAAAELAVPNNIELISYIKQLELRNNKSIINLINYYKHKLNNLENSYILKNPNNLYTGKIQKLDSLVEKAEIFIKRKFDLKLNSYLKLINKLETLNPMQTIKRGYSITKLNDKVINSINEIKIDDEIVTNLEDGIIKSIVVSKKEN